MEKIRAKLDWSRLLGFDQADVSQRNAASRLAKVGGKPSVKLSVKKGIKNLGPRASKVGSKSDISLGTLACKVGQKNAIRSGSRD